MAGLLRKRARLVEPTYIIQAACIILSGIGWPYYHPHIGIIQRYWRMRKPKIHCLGPDCMFQRPNFWTNHVTWSQARLVELVIRSPFIIDRRAADRRTTSYSSHWNHSKILKNGERTEVKKSPTWLYVPRILPLPLCILKRTVLSHRNFRWRSESPMHHMSGGARTKWQWMDQQGKCTESLEVG